MLDVSIDNTGVCFSLFSIDQTDLYRFIRLKDGIYFDIIATRREAYHTDDGTVLAEIALYRNVEVSDHGLWR